MDTVIRAARAVIDGEVRPAAVGISGGKIRTTGPLDDECPASQVVELPEAAVLMPGLVDTHVHINEPGTDWEGFASATAAAAAGGITTLVDMPLDSAPVTTSATALAAKQTAAQGNCRVDVAFWAGVIPGNLDSLEELAAAGALGFKCFLSESGNPSFPPLSPDTFRAAMARVADIGGVMLVHAESGHVIHNSPRPSGSSYASFLRSRPDEAEEAAVALVIDAARSTGARAHIVHVSSAAVLPLLTDARRSGVPVTAETCPHYLTFAAEDIGDCATEFAACPPIRATDNRDALWAGLRDGTLDMIVSDHSPCAPEMKARGDFGRAFGGISSLELGLRAVWTQQRSRDFDLPDVCRWMSEKPAALAGFTDRGRIAVGQRADLCVFGPSLEDVVDAASLKQRHPVTPYDGAVLRGAVMQTWLAGHLIYHWDQVGQPA